MPLKEINATRKPNGQLTSETAYRLKQRAAGLARARSRTDGFKPLIDAARLSNTRRRIQGLQAKIISLGLDCEHVRAWL